MKKMMLIGLGALTLAGAVQAEDLVVPNKEPVALTAEMALLSSYVWRGQYLNDGAVWQPQVTAEQFGLSLNIWANMDLDKSRNGSQGEFSEFDLSLAYTFPIDINDTVFSAGLINYSYPASGDNRAALRDSTTELFASATYTGVPFMIPTFSYFGDVDEVMGTYAKGEVIFPYQVSQYFHIEAGGSAGWGNTRYNSVYWFESRADGMNDYNAFLNATYELLDDVTLSATLVYTALDGTIRDEGGVKYGRNEGVWAGANIAYDF